MLKKTLISFRGLEVKVTDQADEEIMDLLNNTVLGSDGGLRYQLRNIQSRVTAYKDQIRFISLYKANKITGTIGACYRITGSGNLKFPSTYIRYLAFQRQYQAETVTRRKRREVIKPEKDDSFKEKALGIFSRPQLLDFKEYNDTDKQILYAFVESMNERSKNLINQAGYEYVRSFLTVAFSRFSPQIDKRVTKLNDSEKNKMGSLLQEYYKDHTLFNTDFVFFGDRYYVLKEGDEIISGVSAIPSSYKIYKMPGIWGWIIMRILPKTPYFKKLFQPEEFRHLVFDAVYCKKGQEDKLADLFESVCAAEGFNTGLTWLDDRCELFDRLRSGVRMGALNRMLNAKPGLVYIRFINFTDKEKEAFYDSPAYISGFDFS